MKKAFTLIELLVVVLIIGILSSIALPQYQRAVLRSRIAEHLTNLRALSQAEQICYLEKGSTCALADLSIQIPTCKPIPDIGNTCTYSISHESSQVEFDDGKGTKRVKLNFYPNSKEYVYPDYMSSMNFTQPAGFFCSYGAGNNGFCKKLGFSKQADKQGYLFAMD